MNKNLKDYDFVKLVTVFDQFKIGAVKGILEDNDIPYIYYVPDNNNYTLFIFGTNPSGLDIYVPDFLLEKSQDLLDEIFGDDYNKSDLNEK
ncbi:putative signal transducing protein [Peptoniphilus stercorisuis]|uniref:DUF2007 domain-containing protein n=1 Tax=Peptoniphilus stercorisuis TaxID=1436965 RepID=A0ABS4KFN9_9FIRM|nr:DUF2007 domain-containing protein [Peptoniphilus stercorisuis]MBP2025459.1 hypothetical protein [Peptoniphilus stercorisuis]